MANLLIGPMLRYVGETEATVWLEADAACVVEILGQRSETFQVNGRHYAIVPITGLEPDTAVTYEVLLDGVERWPADAACVGPPSRIRTLPRSGPIELAFGSCRVTRPHRAPYTLSVDDHELGTGIDALYGLAVRMRDQDPALLAAPAAADRRSGLRRRGLAGDGGVHPRAARRQRAAGP